MKYAYSLKTQRMKEPDFPYNGQRLTCTAELLDFVYKLQDSDVEKMIIVYLDVQNTLIGILPIIGTVNQAVVYPREVMKHALLCSASGMIMIHNHPSGLLKPSECDIKLTNKIIEVAKILDIAIHDHIIIADEKYYSFREEGLL